MRGNDFLDKIGDIDPKFIEDAERLASRRRKRSFGRWAAAAALIVLVFSSAFFADDIKRIIGIENGNKENTYVEPIPISISDIPYESGGMGFEGYILRDISQLVNGDPWTEDMVITKLPVYLNKAFDKESSGAAPKVIYSEKEMKKILKKAASCLDLKISSMEKIYTKVNVKKTVKRRVNGVPVETETTYDTVLISMTAETNGGELRVTAYDGSLTFTPNKGSIEIPLDVYSDPNEKTWSNETLLYLSGQYEKLLKSFGISDVKTFINEQYDIYGNCRQLYGAVYEAPSGSDEEKVKNFYLENPMIIFSKNSEGGIANISFSGSTLISKDAKTREYMGEYPIISLDEAKERLSLGYYSSSYSGAYKGEEYIAKAELMYRTSVKDEYIMPYYRFYICIDEDLGSDIAAGTHSYAAYYVPAIADEYIIDMPVYDGKFN